MRKYKKSNLAKILLAKTSPQKKKLFSTTLTVSLVICILDTYAILFKSLYWTVSKLFINFNQTSERNLKL